jgi:ketosteroid isomerase-like protein
MKQRPWLVGVLVVALSGLARAQSAGGENADVERIRQEVLKVEREQDEAVARSDTKTLDRIWVDGLVYTTPTGELVTKAQHLADFRSGIRKFDSMKHDNFKVRVYGDTAVLTARSTSVLHYKGQVSTGPRVFTNVYVKMDGRWQLVSHHVTDVAKP